MKFWQITFSNAFFLTEKNVIQILLKFVNKGLIDNKSTPVHVKAWCRRGDQSFPKPKIPHFADICVTALWNAYLFGPKWSINYYSYYASPSRAEFIIMSAMVSQMTSLTIIYTAVYSGADQRKHQISASLAFVREFTGDRWIPSTKGP